MPIPRMAVPEIADQRWCPDWLRWGLTGYLHTVTRVTSPYGGAAAPLARLIEETGERRIVDLGSGAGGPWPGLRDALLEEGVPEVEVVLTDLYPEQASGRFDGSSGIRYHPTPVSALDVPPELPGIRTMFTALHHFDPVDVRRILEAAQRDRVPFAAFEATYRSAGGVAATVLLPLMALVLMPRVRPVRALPLLLTYLPPVLPLAIGWDGLASTLGTYRATEILEIVRKMEDPGYRWSAADVPVKGQPFPMLQVIGRPV